MGGAGSREILTLVNADFIYLVIIASLISLPLSVYAMYHWLDNFAYHTHIAWWNLLIPVMITTLLAISIISSIACRVASQNPMNRLKYK